MLTLKVMEDIQLTTKPRGQQIVAWLLHGNYRNPVAPTHIAFEGEANLGSEPVIFAMNHTDRYNYWPFQYHLWRTRGRFTATWVKGKYYNHPMIRRFMEAMNNIPVPSRGYLVTLDATRVLGRAPSAVAYRLLRDSLDRSGEILLEGPGAVRELARVLREESLSQGVGAEIGALLDSPRDMFGTRFEPGEESYLWALHRVFGEMMEKFVALNRHAFSIGLPIIVFPEGTRSPHLGAGHTGIAQMAALLKATVVPVGCNGSSDAYPGNSPFSRGGRIVYRIGEPLRPEGALAAYQIEREFVPYTSGAEKLHGPLFRGMTDVIMERVNDLLDARHRRLDQGDAAVQGAQRFM